MDAKISELMGRLYANVSELSFPDVSEDVVDELTELENSVEAVAPILQLIGQNPHADFGMPGPLVHFVERFYRNGYEVALLTSVVQSPTSHNLWMLNRLINGSQGDEKKDMLTVLDSIVQRSDLSADTRDLAVNFVQLHKNSAE